MTVPSDQPAKETPSLDLMTAPSSCSVSAQASGVLFQTLADVNGGQTCGSCKHRRVSASPASYLVPRTYTNHRVQKVEGLRLQTVLSYIHQHLHLTTLCPHVAADREATCRCIHIPPAVKAEELASLFHYYLQADLIMSPSQKRGGLTLSFQTCDLNTVTVIYI